MPLRWSETQSTSGEVDFSQYVALHKVLEAAGIKMAVLIHPTHPAYENGHPPSSEASVKAFHSWLATGLRGFEEGQFSIQLASITSGGEPVPAEDYAQLVATIRSVLERVEMTGLPLLGPEFSIGSEKKLAAYLASPRMMDERYIFHRLAADEMPERAPERLKAVRNYFELNGRIGQAEQELRSVGGSSALALKRQAQPLHLVARRWLADRRETGPLLIARLNADQDEGSPPSLLEDGEPTPLYRAAKTFATQLEDYSYSKRLFTGDDRQVIALYMHYRLGRNDPASELKADMVRLVAWTTGEENSEARIGSSAGEFNAVDCEGRPLPDLKAENGTLTITLSPEPQYLTPKELNPFLTVVAASYLPEEMVVRETETPRVAIHNRLAEKIEVVSPTSATIDAGESARVSLPSDGLASLKPQEQTTEIRFAIRGEESSFLLKTKISQWVRPGFVFLPFTEQSLALALQSESGLPARVTVYLTVDGRELEPLEREFVFGAGEREKIAVARLPPDLKVTPFKPVSVEFQSFMRLDLPPLPLRKVVIVPLSPLTPENAFGLLSKSPAEGEQIALRPAPLPQEDFIPRVAPVLIEHAAVKVGAAFSFRFRAAITQPISGEPHSFRMWIRGDGGKREVSIMLRDARDQLFETEPAVVDSGEWHCPEWWLRAPSLRPVGSDPAAQVSFPVRLEAVQFRPASTPPSEAAVELSSPTFYEYPH